MHDEEAVSRAMASLMGAYAGIALFLATFGIYSVLAHSVSRRTHEIGVRVALGARATDVVKLVALPGLLWTSGGILVGLAGAFAVSACSLTCFRVVASSNLT